MKTIAICNLKGGVGKTITSINLAYLLATNYGKRVLICDNDQQGNTSQFFGRYDYDHLGMSEVMERTYEEPGAVIQHTSEPNIDIVTANLSLARTERLVQSEIGGFPQQMRLKAFLDKVAGGYDYSIIDNAPSLGMCVINALAACDYIVIPAKNDKFTFEGIDSLLEQVDEMRAYINPKLTVLGTLVTNYRHNVSNEEGEAWLRKAKQYHVFDTHIRYTDKVDESTFVATPIVIHSPRCGASKDYQAFAAEVLAKIEGAKA